MDKIANRDSQNKLSGIKLVLYASETELGNILQGQIRDYRNYMKIVSKVKGTQPKNLHNFNIFSLYIESFLFDT